VARYTPQFGYFFFVAHLGRVQLAQANPRRFSNGVAKSARNHQAQATRQASPADAEKKIAGRLIGCSR
jgi:hypothetical protein